MDTHCYLIAIGDAEPTAAFNDLLERFAPRFPLRQGVHVCFHSTLLSTDELSRLVRDTLPKGVPFFVAIPKDYHFEPREEAPEETPPSVFE